MNIGQSVVFVNLDLLEKITRRLVEVYIEVGCYSQLYVNEIRKDQVKLSKAKRYLVILAPLVKCIFKINTKTKIQIKTDGAVNQFPAI